MNPNGNIPYWWKDPTGHYKVHHEEGFPLIPLGQGRPERDNIVSKQDIVDLKIDLFHVATVEDFLKIA